MAEIVPVGLQDKLNQAGFQFVPGKASIRTEMDVGLDKVRNRYTTAIDSVNGNIDMNKDDVETWKTFFSTTLANGTKTFLYKDPFTNLDQEFRFVGEYSLKPKGGKVFNVAFIWEYIP